MLVIYNIYFLLSRHMDLVHQFEVFAVFKYFVIKSEFWPRC